MHRKCDFFLKLITSFTIHCTLLLFNNLLRVASEYEVICR